MKEAAPQRLWRTEARQRISRSDIVLVVVGSQPIVPKAYLQKSPWLAPLNRQSLSGKSLHTETDPHRLACLTLVVFTAGAMKT